MFRLRRRNSALDTFARGKSARLNTWWGRWLVEDLPSSQWVDWEHRSPVSGIWFPNKMLFLLCSFAWCLIYLSIPWHYSCQLSRLGFLHRWEHWGGCCPRMCLRAPPPDILCYIRGSDSNGDLPELFSHPSVSGGWFPSLFPHRHPESLIPVMTNLTMPFCTSFL